MNQEHLEILKRGVKAWNKWRRESAGVTPDLANADLRGAHLSKADLSEADLSGADLPEAGLIGAGLRGTHLSRAILLGANLTAVDLRGADLRKANLFGADLRGAVFGGTVLADVDLSVAKGLDAVMHIGPSTIGIDTVYRSEGKIPHIFLRGAGVPDDFIEYMGSLVGKPIEFYSCFISYSSKDQPFADRLYADLQSKGVRCWFAPHDVHGGKKLHEQIDVAIRLHEKLLLILSPNSMTSEWVKTEIAKAREREVREKRQVLFPIRLCSFEALRDWECFDADTGKDSAREIREYFIPDFSNWKDHDSYQDGFAGLLRDLKADRG